MDYLVLCSRAPGNELVSAECEVLTGGIPDSNGLAVCSTVDRIPLAAYLSTGIRMVARGVTLHDLANQVTRLGLSANRFRIEFTCLFPHIPVHKQAAIKVIADAIDGRPDLKNPLVRYLIIVCDNSFYLGEILNEAIRSYQIHDTKPFRTSSSLPSQLARALVNLTHPARTIFDPCCGTGSILLEACATGVKGCGMDSNPKMVGMSRQNLIHFGYHADVKLGDASRSKCVADAVVTDLPYGRFLEPDEENIRSILRHMTSQAPLGVYLAEQDITGWLQESGYRRIRVFRIRKRVGMIRYVHKAHLESS